ncbi:MAG: YcxB family protein [Bacteroidota bacterium]
MESIEKTILFTSEDLQLAYTTHFQKMYPVRSRLLLIIGALSFLIGALLLTFQFFSKTHDYTNWASWFLLCYGFVIAVLYFYNLKRIGKRMYSKMPDFKNPFSYKFTAENIEVKAPNINSNNNWEYYQSALVSPDVIMIYPNKFRFSLFPREHFTEEEFRQLKEWVVAKVKTKEVKS